MTAKELSVRAEFENLGFQETDTGGGCTAWVMGLSHGRECLVTNGDLEAPLDMDSPAVLSVLHDGSCEVLCYMSFANTRTLFDWLIALSQGQQSDDCSEWIASWAAVGGQ